MAEEDIISQLEAYEADPTLITESVYSPTAVDYEDGRLPFSQIHLNYLKKHKHVDPKQYLSNLKIMCKKR